MHILTANRGLYWFTVTTVAVKYCDVLSGDIG